MKFISDLTMQLGIPTFGAGVRWLREELETRDVSVHITHACLREFVVDADAAAKAERSNGNTLEPYAARLRRQISVRAEFLRAWTRSDDRVDIDDASLQRSIRIARQFALPRAWSLTEPVASEARHATPTYLYWASAR
jgi:hypothetical protein